jgi:Phytanoyl-CoA dioxygenase (PhyH)
MDARPVPEEVLFSASTHPSPEEIVSAIRRHGVALLKGAAGRDAVYRVRAGLEGYEAQLRDEVAAGRREVDNLDRRLSAGTTGPHLETEMLELLAELGPVIARHVEHYLGCDDLVVPDNHFLFRKLSPGATDAALKRGNRHNFHQDHDLIPGAFPFNVWVPLSPIDDEALGLSFAFPSTSQVFPIPVDIESYLEKNDGFIWTPNMNAGDILLFHRYTIHGTYFTLNRPVPRYSAEFRVGGRSAAPATHAQFLRSFGDNRASVSH